MGWLDRWIRGRERYLQTDEPERAFAPDPESDFFPLYPVRTNDEAYDFIRTRGITLVRASSGETADLSAFSGGMLLFVTLWEPYSAKSIGALKGKLDAGQGGMFGVVAFEHTRDEVLESSQSWFLPYAWTLAPESAELKPLIGRVPFTVFIGSDGQVSQITEGKP